MWNPDLPSICLLEVFKKVLNDRGEDAAIEAVALMNQGRVVDLDASIAISAAKIGAERKLPLADSVILATAKAVGALTGRRMPTSKGSKG